MKAAVVSLGSTSSQWTVEALRKYFDEVDSINIKYIEISFSGKKAKILYKGKPLPQYDCILAKGSFRYANILEALTLLRRDEAYMPIHHSAFTIAHDKLLTQLELQKNNLPMPKTYLASTVNAARSILERLNYPIIMKFPQGTQGKGVLFAESFASASSILDALSSLRQPFIIQEYIETDGTDLRVFVLGDKVVAAYQRRSNGKETRANIHAGGTGEEVMLDEETKRIALNAAKSVKADLCGVDILMSHKGPVVLEVNLSPGLQGITQYTGIDVADRIAKFLYERTKEKMQKQLTKSADEILADIDQMTPTNKKLHSQQANMITENDDVKEEILITELDFRASRVLLPEVVTKSAQLTDKQEYEFISKPGEVRIRKFTINNIDDN
jgi:ribosomal protein S6--L-glutamate ligase